MVVIAGGIPGLHTAEIYHVVNLGVEWEETLKAWGLNASYARNLISYPSPSQNPASAIRSVGEQKQDGESSK